MHAAFLFVYLGALIVMGAIKARKVKTQEDFSLAGRGLGGVVLVGTLLATWIGTGSIYGNAERAYQDGLPTLILPLSSATGIVILWLLAGRIRRTNKFTIQDILEDRFGVVARLFGTVALLAGYLIIISYQYRAGSAVLENLWPSIKEPLDAVTGERPPSTTGIVIVASFVIAYTALAGMISVAYTDLANGILMVVGLAIALPVVLSQAGGPTAALESLPDAARSVTGTYSLPMVVSYLLPAFLLILGDANMYQRFFSAKDEKTARRSAVGMFFGVLLLDWLIIGVAVGGAALVVQGKMPAPDNPAHTIVDVAFHALPSFLGAMLMATVVAVIVSTADSFLLAPSTSIMRDLYQRFLRPDASGKEVVLVSRLVVVGLGLIALFLSFQSSEFFDIALFSYTLYGAAITPPLLAAFFWPRATPAGAVCSMFVGLASAVVWKFWVAAAPATEEPPLPGEEVPVRVVAWFQDAGFPGLAEFFGDLNAALPAVVLSVVALVVVSLLGKAPAPPEVRA